MKDVRESYTAFHEAHRPTHVYPTEWVVRTLLGKYPKLSLDKSHYQGGTILDIGFGDGRNWPLLHNLGLAISGVEITEKIVSLGHARALALAIPVTLKVGSNSALPFPDRSFDYILACHSAYYLDAGTVFADNVRELQRVLKPGGSLLASLPEAHGSIFDGCVDLGDGRAEIRNDVWGLREGYVFRRFHSEDEVREAFEPLFESFSIGLCRDDYFGFRVNVFLLACRKSATSDAAVQPLGAGPRPEQGREAIGHWARHPPSILVFPAVNQAALDFLHGARNRGERVVAATSVLEHGLTESFGDVTLVPFIHDPRFAERFLALLESQNIRSVFAPVASVHVFLARFILDRGLKLELLGASPIRQQVEAYRTLATRAEAAMGFVGACSKGASTLSRLDVSAILRVAASLYGESNDDKIAAMMAVFASAPKGDVIEIGSLMGRSASVLAYLAQHYSTGNVLAVDPWAAEAAVQKDSPEINQTALVAEWDDEVLHEAFVINLLPLAAGRFNYLRMRSEQGFEVYLGQSAVTSAHFGTVAYSGTIAVIHIDGNHDFRKVSLDCELWLRRLAPGGWVILDDYVWAHGDGPRRAGDALLEVRREDVERAFVCGKALFLKLR